MIDFKRAEGLVESIEAESRQPAPSHANLARLLALFSRTILEGLSESSTNEIPPMNQATTVSTAKTIELPPKPEPLAKGPRGRKSTKKVGK